MVRQDFLFPISEPSAKERPVNVASVPQRSPFRYPGGKTWLVPVFRRWMASLPAKPELLVEPFAGGGIISLTTAFEQRARHTILVELDTQVASVWQSILSEDAEWLAKRILGFDLSAATLHSELDKHPRTTRERAFHTILRNRTTRGGILAEGAGFIKVGEAGKGIASRWYPGTLARRIRDIAAVSHRLTFVEGDAFTEIAKHRENPDAVFFIDPPYTAGGKRAGSRLYAHSEIDHERLFHECEQLAGEFLMTYDHTPEVISLARRHGFATRAIAMKNTHHTEMSELLVGKNLDWIP